LPQQAERHWGSEQSPVPLQSLSDPSVQLDSQVTGEPQSGGQEPHPLHRSHPEQVPSPQALHGKPNGPEVQSGSAQSLIPSQSSSMELVQISAGGAPQSPGQLQRFSDGAPQTESPQTKAGDKDGNAAVADHATTARVNRLPDWAAPSFHCRVPRFIGHLPFQNGRIRTRQD